MNFPSESDNAAFFHEQLVIAKKDNMFGLFKKGIAPTQ
jgi:hypothetical protein